MEIIRSALQQYSLFGNTAWEYTLSIAVFIGSAIALKLFQLIVVARLKTLSKRTRSDIDDILIDIVSHIRPPFYLVLSIFLAAKYLDFTPFVERVLSAAIFVILFAEAIQAIKRLIGHLIQRHVANLDVEEEADKAHTKMMLEMAQWLAVVLLWIIALLLLLSNFGINVTSLIASLGIGGIAIALAAQNILGDLFSSFSIFFDKPFQIGDYIVIGDDGGTVEHIGMKTTRLRTLRGEQLVVSNRELTTERVQNFGRLHRRRELFTIGVEYETPQKLLKQIPDIIATAIEGRDEVEFDRAHLVGFGDSSINYEVVYYVNSDDFTLYMNIKQDINLTLFNALTEKGIAMAYPTQVIHVKK